MRKKLFTFFLALMTTMSLMAIGIGDGRSKENAIEYSWDDGVQQSSGTRWYRLDLTPLYNSVDTIRLQITNPSNSESVDVTCKMTIMDVEENIAQTLAPQSMYEAWEFYYEPLVRESQTELYFIVTSTGRVQLKWQWAYKSGDSCEDARRPPHHEAGTKWYKILAPYQEENWEIDSLTIYFFNENYDGNTIPNTISVSFKADCDSPAFNSQTFTIEPSGEKTIAFSGELLASLGWPDLVFSCTSSAYCGISYEYYGHIPGETCLGPIDLNEDPILHPADMVRWYGVKLYDEAAGLIPEGKDLCIIISNISNEVANYIADFYLYCLGDGYTKINELAPYSNDSIVFSRELMAGWSNLLIKFESSQANYIRADFIDAHKRDTMIVTYVTEPFCVGDRYDFESEVSWYQGILESDKDTLRFEEVWELLRDDEQGLHFYDSIVHHTIIPLKKPELYLQGDVALEPVVAKGENIDTNNSIASLKQQFANDATDLTMEVTDIKWQVLNGTIWQDMPYYVELTETLVTLRYIITTECGVQDTSANFVYHLTPESCLIASGTCGDNLTWELSCDSVLTISGTGNMWDNPSWTPYNSEIRTAVLPEGLTSIGEKAFYHCSVLTSINLPNSVDSIGDKAFVGCDSLTEPLYNARIFAYMPKIGYGAYSIPEGIVSIAAHALELCAGHGWVLAEITIPSSVEYIGKQALGSPFLMKITCYAVVPPLCDPSAFLAFDEETWLSFTVNKSTCKLYVPAGSIDLYKAADVWKEFTNILPISAEEKEVYVVEIETTENTVSIAWPQVDNAYTYELVIKDQNGNVICTLTFNAQGQLTSIKFGVPAQNGAPQHTQAAGFAFTVTGLEAGTTYDYTIVAKEEAGAVLNTETGSFTTLGGEQAIDDVDVNTKAVKFLRDGQILIQKGDKLFDLRGQEVK